MVASSHGDAGALVEAARRLREKGASRIFHAGDILGEAGDALAALKAASEMECVLGNHDLLVLGGDEVHEYDEKTLRSARAARKSLAGSPEKHATFRELPHRILTPAFVVVHESVAPPYYARRTKRRRRSYGWDVGSTADENTSAVCYGRIDRPHFIGSDHLPYIIRSHPGTGFRIERPREGERIPLPPRSVVSLPSLYAPRDEFGVGYVLADLTPEGVEVVFFRLD